MVGSNALAVEAAAEEAKRLGYNTMILSTVIQGEAREVARVTPRSRARFTHRQARSDVRPASSRAARPPSPIRGKGLGGRNQEFALAAAIEIAGLGDTVILSAGTDGTDGPTDAAGAIADGNHARTRAKRSASMPPQFLANNDSYRFFEATGDLIKTGPTGTNVADIQVDPGSLALFVLHLQAASAAWVARRVRRDGSCGFGNVVVSSALALRTVMDPRPVSSRNSGPPPVLPVMVAP